MSTDIEQMLASLGPRVAAYLLYTDEDGLHSKARETLRSEIHEALRMLKASVGDFASAASTAREKVLTPALTCAWAREHYKLYAAIRMCDDDFFRLMYAKLPPLPLPLPFPITSSSGTALETTI